MFSEQDGHFHIRDLFLVCFKNSFCVSFPQLKWYHELQYEQQMQSQFCEKSLKQAGQDISSDSAELANKVKGSRKD